MSAVYPDFVRGCLAAGLDSATLRLQLLGAYVYDPAHTDLADVDHLIGASAPVTIDTITTAGLTIAPVTFVSIPGTTPVIAAVLYRDAGGGAKPLLAYLDRRGDFVGIDLVPNGDGFVFTWLAPVLTL